MDTESKFCEKQDPYPRSFFNFSSSGCLRHGRN